VDALRDLRELERVAEQDEVLGRRPPQFGRVADGDILVGHYPARPIR
jgi:hypothetical protein